jgi:hypothetical protein
MSFKDEIRRPALQFTGMAGGGDPSASMLALGVERLAI